MLSLFKAVILAENVVYALKILAEKCSLRSFMASRKASRKFSQASRKPEKLRLWGVLVTVLYSFFSYGFLPRRIKVFRRYRQRPLRQRPSWPLRSIVHRRG